MPCDPGMGKGEGEVEGEEETETSALFNEEEEWRGKQEDVHASAEKARERFENEVSKIGAINHDTASGRHHCHCHGYRCHHDRHHRNHSHHYCDKVRNICATIQLVVVARQDTIAKLERAADYLDSVWLRCRVSSATHWYLVL